MVESVAYQSTLAWLVTQEMTRRREYTPIEEFTDPRSKYNRIVDTLNGPASNGKLWAKPTHSEFINPFCAYDDVPHDDLLDALSIALASLGIVDLGEDGYHAMDEDIPTLDYARGAP